MRVSDSLKTDVLIIGAGAAGIRAAMAAAEAGAEVTVVSKGPVAKSGSSFSSVSGGWGMQALVGKERTEENLEAFHNDIMDAGLGMCDPKLVRVLVEESGPRLEDLITCGIRFKKDSQGNPVRVKGCFSDTERAFLTEDAQNIRQSFLSIIGRSNAKIVTGYAAELITDSGVCRGAWVINPSDEMLRIDAKATILATGGGAAIYSDHFVADQEMGDGYVLAHRAGAELRNLEFIQFVLGLKSGHTRRFLPTTALQQARMLTDSEANDILETSVPDQALRSRAVEDRLKHVPFSCRDTSFLVDMAVAVAKRQGKKVYWRGEGALPQRVEVAHFSHAFNGGVKIDERAESTVSGLFAAGEVAAGPHGADRVGGCMMAATQVFGERAGRFAASFALGRERPPQREKTLEIPGEFSSPTGTPEANRELMEISAISRRESSRCLGICRDDDGLRRCLSLIEDLSRSLEDNRPATLRLFVSTTHQVVLTRLVAEAALRRVESLGSHYRSDSPAPHRHPGQRGLPDATTPSPGISGGMVHEHRF